MKHKIVVTTAANDAIIAVCLDCDEVIFDDNNVRGSLNRINAAAKRHKKSKKIVAKLVEAVETPDGISATYQIVDPKMAEYIYRHQTDGLSAYGISKSTQPNN